MISILAIVLLFLAIIENDNFQVHKVNEKESFQVHKVTKNENFDKANVNYTKVIK